jgi:hypothetical protein
MAELMWKDTSGGCYATGEAHVYMITVTPHEVRLTRWPLARNDDHTMHALINALILPGSDLLRAKRIAARHQGDLGQPGNNPLAGGWLLSPQDVPVDSTGVPVTGAMIAAVQQAWDAEFSRPRPGGDAALDYQMARSAVETVRSLVMPAGLRGGSAHLPHGGAI